jgi:opacity protein-like surface antigen
MKKFMLMAATALVLFPLSAKATTDYWGPDKFFYGLEGGLAVPTDTNVTLSGGIVGSGHFKYNDGYELGGFVGYNFSDLLKGELQVSYARADYDKLSGTLTGGPIIGSGDISLNGHVDAWTGMANAIVTPFNFHGLKPYAGGGVGISEAHSKIDSASFGGVTATVDSSQRQTDFAADGILGLNYALGKDMSVGARYQYLWINSASTYTSNGVTEHDGNFSANVFTLRLNWNF